MTNGLHPSTLVGKCHVCQHTDREIEHCSLCDHWFCEQCDKDLARRSWGFIEQLLKGRQEGCCGPNRVRYMTDCYGIELPATVTHDDRMFWTAVVTYDGKAYLGQGDKISTAVEEAIRAASI